LFINDYGWQARSHQWERQKWIIGANKRRCVLGKDLCHSKCILFTLLLGPADATFLLRELAFLVPLALLLAPYRPNMGGRYEFF
jgi:hypothetical protein